MEIRKLNTLRGIAALIVLIEHYSNATGLWNKLLGEGAGQLGVMLFFVLSGFLMSHIYIQKDFNSKNIKNFMLARFARVLPLFVFVVLASFFLLKFNIAEHIVYAIKDEKALLSHLLLLSGVSVLWTVPTEIWFYVFFLLLWYLHSLKSSYLYTLIVSVFAVMVVLKFPSREFNFSGFTVQIFIFGGLQYFLIGIVFGKIYGKLEPLFTKKNIFVLAMLLLPLMYPHVFSSLFGHTFVGDPRLLWKDVGIFFIVSLVFFAILFLVPDDNKFLVHRPGDFAGKISYSLYILHIPVLTSLAPYAKEHPIAGLPIFLIICVILSWLSFLVLENPSRKAIKSTFLKHNDLNALSVKLFSKTDFKSAP